MMRVTPVLGPPPVQTSRTRMVVGVAAAAFVVAGLLLMAVLDDVAYGIAVGAIGTAALLLALTSGT